MTDFEKVLRASTAELFNDQWYEKTTLKLMKCQEEVKGYVYFIKVPHSKNIKIGMSINLTNRLQGHRLNSNSNIFLLGYIYSSDYIPLERLLHKKYIDKREQGEWFAISDNVAIGEILNREGKVVNSYIGKDSSFFDGEPISIPDMDYNQNLLPNPFYEDMSILCFKDLPIGEKISKLDIYKDAIKTHSKYSKLRNKTVTEALKEYLGFNGKSFEEGKSGSFRYIIIKN